MNFGKALKDLKDGKRVAREGWNGKNMFIKLIDNYAVYNEKPLGIRGSLLPWIGMKTAQGDFVPWLASQTDILAEDWEEIKTK